MWDICGDRVRKLLCCKIYQYIKITLKITIFLFLSEAWFLFLYFYLSTSNQDFKIIKSYHIEIINNTKTLEEL